MKARIIVAVVTSLLLAVTAGAGMYSIPVHSGMGRIAIDLATGDAWVMAVETYIRGIEGSMFDLSMGEPGLANGYFTAAISLGPASGLPPMMLNANMGNTVYPSGLEVTWYYDDTPDQDLTDPASFQDGIPIAVFRNTTAIQVDLNPAPPPNALSDSFNVMWDKYDLVWSAPFEFNGIKYDLKKIMPDGFTYRHFSSNVAAVEASPTAMFLTFPYTTVGSVIEKGRKNHKDDESAD